MGLGSCVIANIQAFPSSFFGGYSVNVKHMKNSSSSFLRRLCLAVGIWSLGVIQVVVGCGFQAAASTHAHRYYCLHCTSLFPLSPLLSLFYHLQWMVFTLWRDFCLFASLNFSPAFHALLFHTLFFTHTHAHILYNLHLSSHLMSICMVCAPFAPCIAGIPPFSPFPFLLLPHISSLSVCFSFPFTHTP